VAIQFEVSSGRAQQDQDNRGCGVPQRARKPHRSQLCSSPRPHPTQSRGPSHDWSSANDLVVKLLPLVKRVALQMRGRLPANVELDDLVSDGTVGLIDAVRKFDPAKGVTIESYARHRIRGAILDSLRNQDYASRDMRRRIKKVESTCQALERRLGRPAEDAEMAKAMGLSLKKWYVRVAELGRIGFEGTGSKIPQEFARRVDEKDLPAPRDENPFALCYQREQNELLSRALGRLADRERLIITFYYKDGLTMRQIGSRLGIDESRVSQLHSSAIRRLRSRVAEMLHRVSRGTGLRPAPCATSLRRPTPGPVAACSRNATVA
jgi:RNA polymerase sigma factor for flagellar operon FliA